MVIMEMMVMEGMMVMITESDDHDGGNDEREKIVEFLCATHSSYHIYELS